MRSVLNLMRKGRKQQAQVTDTSTSSSERPDYRPYLYAIEYDQRERSDSDENVLMRRRDVLNQAAPIEGFTPLPRCPRCGTALAHSQMQCHGCGLDTGWP